MSRIGNAPIPVPDGVTVTIEPARVAVAGPLGTLQQQVPTRMKIEQRDGEVVVTRPTERGEDRALHGLTRPLAARACAGSPRPYDVYPPRPLLFGRASSASPATRPAFARLSRLPATSQEPQDA